MYYYRRLFLYISGELVLAAYWLVIRITIGHAM
jgi:hypothetical protein